MLDREGFRPNVGIVLLNARNEVFWGKRLREHSWQFPQGGIKFGETPVQAMYRELHEEVGLKPEHVKVIGRTRDWLRYEVPDRFIRREVRGHYRGQKQIWFLLRMVGRDCDICLRATNHPEFDAWRWNSYWVPLDAVIEFKRDVYHLALTELSRFVRRMHLKADAEGNGTMPDMHGDMSANTGFDAGAQHTHGLHEEMHEDALHAMASSAARPEIRRELSHEVSHEVRRTHLRVVTQSHTIIVSDGSVERTDLDEDVASELVSPIIHK